MRSLITTTSAVEGTQWQDVAQVGVGRLHVLYQRANTSALQSRERVPEDDVECID